MSQATILVLVLVAIAAAIIIGYKTNKNIGVIAMLFAYVLGVFVFGQPAANILALWPSSLLLTMLSIMLFYGYATTNGTLKLLAEKILYPFRHNVRILPFLVFICAMVLAAVAGNTAVTGFFPVLCFTNALSAGWQPVLFSCISCFGALIGASMPWAQTGAIISGILQGTEAAEFSQTYTLRIAVGTIIAFSIFIVILYFVTKSYQVKSVEMEKPAKFSPVQLKTVILLAIVALAVIVPSLAGVLAPQTALGMMSKNFNLALITISGAAFCAFLNLGDEKEVIKRIPLGTFIMICGVSTLVSLAQAMGATEYLGTLIGDGLPAWILPPIFVLLGGVMSTFSTYTAVIPILMPVAVSIAAPNGMDPVALLTASFVGAACTTVSPFSSGGMMTMAQCPDEAKRTALFKQQFIAAMSCMAFMTVMAAVGLLGII